MPDQKISQLTAGGAAQATDLLPVARSGTNVSLLAKDLATALERLAASGQSLTGTQATSLVDLAATWNTTGTPTAIKLNVTDTASNASSLLMDLQVGGVSQFRVLKTGAAAAVNIIRDIASTGGVNFAGGVYVKFAGNGVYPTASSFGNTATPSAATDLGFTPVGNQGYSWRNVVLNGSLVWDNLVSNPSDLVLTRDAAATLAQRNSTNAQTFRVYNTFTDVSNYERGSIAATASGFDIGHEAAGTGTKRPVRILGASLTGSEAVSALQINQTWNTTGTPTAILANITDTASNASSLLMDLQRGGTSRMSVDKNGIITVTANVGAGYPSMSFGAVSASPANAAVYREGAVGSLVLRTHAQNLLWVYGDGSTRAVAWPDATGLWWTNGSPGSFAPTLALWRDADNIFAQRNTTNAQTFNIYNTYTSATNYERLSIAATSAGAVRIRTNKGSGGGTARALELGTDDTTRVTIPTTGGCVVGTAALATNATDGFLYVPTCAGTPTGTPTAQTGTAPIVVDTTNNKLYFYSGAAWRDAGP